MYTVGFETSLEFLHTLFIFINTYKRYYFNCYEVDLWKKTEKKFW